MIRSFLTACAALVVSCGIALASNVTVPPLGNTHLHLGGGTVFVPYDTTNLNATVDGRFSSTFYLPIQTNSVGFALTNFVDGQVANVQVSQIGTNALASVTVSNTAMLYYVQSNSPNLLLNVQYFDGTYHVRALVGAQQPTIPVGYLALSTNQTTFLPTAPQFIGQSIIWVSNGYPYITLSTNGPALGVGTNRWTGTNKLGW